MVLGTDVLVASSVGLMHSAVTLNDTFVGFPPSGGALSGPIAQDRVALSTATGCALDLGLAGATLSLTLLPPLDMHSRSALASAVGASTSRRPPRTGATDSSAAPLLIAAAVAAAPAAANGAVPSAFL